MIRFIAAIDSRSGLAEDHGIPWGRKLTSDIAQFRSRTRGGVLMMGYGWYQEQQKPLSERRNLVATTKPGPLREGFERVGDAREFLKSFKGDIWVGGGAGLFAATIDLADELYLTKVDGDFKCTKFFPDYQGSFELISASETHRENGISFVFEIWKKRAQQ